MSGHKQGLLIQKQMQLAHKVELCVGPLSHSCSSSRSYKLEGPIFRALLVLLEEVWSCPGNLWIQGVLVTKFYEGRVCFPPSESLWLSHNSITRRLAVEIYNCHQHLSDVWPHPAVWKQKWEENWALRYSTEQRSWARTFSLNTMPPIPKSLRWFRRIFYQMPPE